MEYRQNTSSFVYKSFLHLQSALLPLQIIYNLMEPLVHPIVYGWLELAAQAEYHPYLSSNSPGQSNVICIDADIQRTFPDWLSDSEKSQLRECLVKAAAEFSELGYRSGFSHITAVLNKLTNCNFDFTMSILKYFLFSKNIGFGKMLLNGQQVELTHLFNALLQKQAPKVFDNKWFTGSLLLVQFQSFFTVMTEWESIDQIAILWDKVFRSNLFMLFEIIINYMKIIDPDLIEIPFKIRINSGVLGELEQTTLRPLDQYGDV